MGSKRPNKWLQFYRPMFASEGDARTFVEPLEAVGIGDPRHQAKIMMHQTQRLISLADDIPSIDAATKHCNCSFFLSVPSTLLSCSKILLVRANHEPTCGTSLNGFYHLNNNSNFALAS